MGTASISPPDDLTLVRRAQAGDRGAFDQLVRKYHRKVLRLMLRYTRNASDAEDAAQEAFMLAYRGILQFRRECSFYTWLYRISINSAKNVLAARARHCTTSLAEAGYFGESDSTLEITDATTPENVALSEEICRLVNAAVDSLPEAQRTAVLLRELEGRSYEAIAAVMRSPVGTVRSRIYRARDCIDQHLRVVLDGGLGRMHAASCSQTRSAPLRA